MFALSFLLELAVGSMPNIKSLRMTYGPAIFSERKLEYFLRVQSPQQGHFRVLSRGVRSMHVRALQLDIVFVFVKTAAR